VGGGNVKKKCRFGKSGYIEKLFIMTSSVLVKINVLISVKRCTYITQSRKSFCTSPSCRPQLCLCLESVGLAQKDSLLLFMISSAINNTVP
jgi:hypothetical protein